MYCSLELDPSTAYPSIRTHPWEMNDLLNNVADLSVLVMIASVHVKARLGERERGQTCVRYVIIRARLTKCHKRRALESCVTDAVAGKRLNSVSFIHSPCAQPNFNYRSQTI